MSRSRSDATRKLAAHSAGEERAADELAPMIYDDLRALARRYLSRERSGTLQPTALVHEAYLRMIDIDRMDWKGKTHFFAMAATQMRRILVCGDSDGDGCDDCWIGWYYPGLDGQDADGEPQSPGQIDFYLIRVENDCPGPGSMGAASDGTPRSAAACP